MPTNSNHPATSLYLSLSSAASESSLTSSKTLLMLEIATAEAIKTPKQSTCRYQHKHYKMLVTVTM